MYVSPWLRLGWTGSRKMCCDQLPSIRATEESRNGSARVYRAGTNRQRRARGTPPRNSSSSTTHFAKAVQRPERSATHGSSTQLPIAYRNQYLPTSGVELFMLELLADELHSTRGSNLQDKVKWAVPLVAFGGGGIHLPAVVATMVHDAVVEPVHPRRHTHQGRQHVGTDEVKNPVL